jgi:hypothetical protein
MCYGEVDNIFTVHRVHHAIFAEVPNNLHFNHSAQILIDVNKLGKQVKII